MTIINKPATDKYRKEYDRIFKKHQSPAGGESDGSMQTTEEEAMRNRKIPIAHFPPFEEVSK